MTTGCYGYWPAQAGSWLSAYCCLWWGHWYTSLERFWLAAHCFPFWCWSWHSAYFCRIADSSCFAVRSMHLHHDASLHLLLECWEETAGSSGCCWRQRAAAYSEIGLSAQGCCCASLGLLQDRYRYWCSFWFGGFCCLPKCSCVALDVQYCLGVKCSCWGFLAGWCFCPSTSWTWPLLCYSSSILWRSSPPHWYYSMPSSLRWCSPMARLPQIR